MNERGIVTGAGISRESGLATFRDADGIWAKRSNAAGIAAGIEDVATPEAFARDPARVQAFYSTMQGGSSCVTLLFSRTPPTTRSHG